MWRHGWIIGGTEDWTGALSVVAGYFARIIRGTENYKIGIFHSLEQPFTFETV